MGRKVGPMRVLPRHPGHGARAWEKMKCEHRGTSASRCRPPAATPSGSLETSGLAHHCPLRDAQKEVTRGRVILVTVSRRLSLFQSLFLSPSWVQVKFEKACLLERKFIFSVYIIVIPISFQVELNSQLNLFQKKINRKLLQSVNIG